MNTSVHGHQNGLELVPSERQQEISAAIAAMTHPVRKHAATALRDEFLVAMLQAGWSDPVAVQPDVSDITITSKKAGTGLCLQVGGNMSRLYADLLKMQTMYLDSSLSSGAFVLPSREMAKVLGDNLAQADRLIRELQVFRKVITIPLVIYSLVD
jgi:hypothetical protein